MSMQPTHSTEIVRGNVSSALLEAALLLAIGFYMRLGGWHGEGIRVYVLSVDVVVWTILIGGFLFLGSALLCWTGRPWALLVDGLLSILIGVVFVGCGIIWLSQQDFLGLLIIVFGLYDFNAAKGSWASYRMAVATSRFPTSFAQSQDSTQTEAPPVDPEAKSEALERLMSTKQARPAVPAKVDLRPKNEPVPDGFLAELGREKEPRQD